MTPLASTGSASASGSQPSYECLSEQLRSFSYYLRQGGGDFRLALVRSFIAVTVKSDSADYWNCDPCLLKLG